MRSGNHEVTKTKMLKFLMKKRKKNDLGAMNPAQLHRMTCSLISDKDVQVEITKVRNHEEK